MSRAKSQFKIGMIAWMILCPILVGAAWFGRGLYDRLFMLEGQIVVVNATAEDHMVRIVFPANEEMEINLKAGDSSRSLVGKTGEGPIDVTIDGTPRDEVGYVTSMNGLIILTIDEDRVIFSQISL
jgi:hypothetical protein